MPIGKKILVVVVASALIVALSILPVLLGAPPPADTPDLALPPKPLHIPPEILKPPWLEERRAVQLAELAAADVFRDFAFVDRYAESGLDFVHRIVDDSGKNYLPDHYDHGNGLAAADIDGDGWPDLYFANQAGPNGMWRNAGTGRFEDWTTPALALADRICVAASFADTDNDGDADLYVTSVRGGNVLLANDGMGYFADITEGSGLGYRGHSSTGVFFDYDRDGLVDLLLNNVGAYTREETVANSVGPAYYPGRERAFALHLRPELGEASILYRNMGDNRFVDASTATGFVDSSWAGDASIFDANGDGWLDIYVLNMQGHDQYYENEQGRRFIRKSRAAFPRTPWGSMGAQVFDWDNDGRFDLYITDMHSDMSAAVAWDEEKAKSAVAYSEDFLQSGGLSIFGNAFYRGLDGSDEISTAIGAETYWPWGLSTGDLNADGWEDVFVTGSMNYPFRYGVNSLLLNDRGRRLVDAEFALGVEPRRRTSTRFFVLDCAGADRRHKHCGGEFATVAVYGARGSRSSVLLDIDGDGDLDVVTNDFNSEPMVLLSDLAQRRPALRYMLVDLVGSRSNRDGLGAVVRLRVGARALSQVRDGRSGYLSQSLLPLYFGLDGAEMVDSLEVRWPSGQRQLLAGPIAANQRLVIAEPP